MKKTFLIFILLFLYLFIGKRCSTTAPLIDAQYIEHDSVTDNKIKESFKSKRSAGHAMVVVCYGMEGFRNHLYNIEFEPKMDEKGDLFWSFLDIETWFNPIGGNSNSIRSITSSFKSDTHPNDLKNSIFNGDYMAKVAILDNSFINFNRRLIGFQDYGYTFKLAFKMGTLVPAKDGNKGYYPLITDYVLLQKKDIFDPNLIVVEPKIKIEYSPPPQ
jgi:hypothetical protein